MTPFESLLELLTENWQLEVWVVAKLGMLLALFLYFMFSLVVVRQIKLMTRTLNGLLEKELMLGARILVGLSIAVFVLAIVIL